MFVFHTRFVRSYAGETIGILRHLRVEQWKKKKTRFKINVPHNWELNEQILLTDEDLDALVEVRKRKIEELQKELEELR